MSNKKKVRVFQFNNLIMSHTPTTNMLHIHIKCIRGDRLKKGVKSCTQGQSNYIKTNSFPNWLNRIEMNIAICEMAKCEM